jgi:hypothetical protein
LRNKLRVTLLPFQPYTNREDGVGRYSYRLWLRNKFRVTLLPFQHYTNRENGVGQYSYCLPLRNIVLLMPLQKAQVLTQRRKAAKILKKTFDLLKQQISNQFHFFTQFLVFFAP